MLSALWGIIAAAIIGAVALWQNKRYKELSEQMMDLQYRPELYICSFFSCPNYDKCDDCSLHTEYIVWPTRGFSETRIGALCFDLHNIPIYWLNVRKVIVDGREISVNFRSPNGGTILDEKQLHICVIFPDQYSEGEHRATMFFTYKNAYDAFYSKKITMYFNVDKNHQVYLKNVYTSCAIKITENKYWSDIKIVEQEIIF